MSHMYPEARAKTATCGFCGKALGREYYFCCHVCGATYCYIHMSHHRRAHRALAPASLTSS